MRSSLEPLGQRVRTVALMVTVTLTYIKVRFDGLLGFPGGLVDDGESVEQGLNRELEEEINLNLDEVKITESDLICIQRPTINDEDPNLVCYFYAKGLFRVPAVHSYSPRRSVDPSGHSRRVFN